MLRCQVLASSCFGPMAPWRLLCHTEVAATSQRDKSKEQSVFAFCWSKPSRQPHFGGYLWSMALAVARRSELVDQGIKQLGFAKRHPRPCFSGASFHRAVADKRFSTTLFFGGSFHSWSTIIESDILANPGDTRQYARHKFWTQRCHVRDGGWWEKKLTTWVWIAS